MRRADAKKHILGVLLNDLQNDDGALFGDEVADAGEESRLWKTFNAARDELIKEFKRRTE